MRFLMALALTLAPVPTALACTCAGPGAPCSGAASSAAVFTGTVLDIANPAPPVPVRPPNTGRMPASRRAVDAAPPPRLLRVVRLQIGEPLSGLDPGQKEIVIGTGFGDGDCGYPFRVGLDYLVYAFKNGEGRLETGICSRTRPLAQAAEDLTYFHTNTAETSRIRVLTSVWDAPGKSGVPIIAEGGGSRHQELTNAAGDAVFTGLPPGEYTIHSESDGDLPDDPKVRLYAKGCLDVPLFRTLRINGQVMTRNGLPAARIEVEVRSVQGVPASGAMTGPDGRYELRIYKAGQYYVGINLNHTPTRNTPYPRWFYPGTGDPAVATEIDFSGKPEIRTYDFSLPDPQAERAIDGIVLRADGQPAPRTAISVFDSSRSIIAQGRADPDGRFTLHVFAGTIYRLHAVWQGNGQQTAVSAAPVDIPGDTSPLSLRLTLTQPGNSALEELRSRFGGKR